MARGQQPFVDPMTRLLAEIARRARDQARTKIQSETLRDALRIDLVPTEGTATIGVPYFWAIYYHDGRGPVHAKPGRFLVYFKDPADDPRIQAGYPVRAADIIHLTKEQFLTSLAAGQLVVTRAVGPAPPHPFFTRGMDDFQEKVHEPARQFMHDIMDGLGFIGTKKDKAGFPLK